MSDRELLIRFKAEAKDRKVDTTNEQGYGGYRGTEFRMDKLIYMEVLSYFRFEEPKVTPKFLYGTTKISEVEFFTKLKKMYGKVKV
jgi:hypothetical protein